VRETHRFDFLWVRPLDVVAALQARTYATDGSVVLEVRDPLEIAAGRYRLDVSGGRATCRRTDESADLTLPVRALGAVYLGGIRLAGLHAAGWLDEERAGAVR